MSTIALCCYWCKACCCFNSFNGDVSVTNIKKIYMVWKSQVLKSLDVRQCRHFLARTALHDWIQCALKIPSVSGCAHVLDLAVSLAYILHWRVKLEKNMDICIMLYRINCTCESKDVSRLSATLKHPYFCSPSSMTDISAEATDHLYFSWILHGIGCYAIHFPCIIVSLNSVYGLVHRSPLSSNVSQVCLSSFSLKVSAQHHAIEQNWKKFYVYKTQKPKLVFSAVWVSVADLFTTFFYLLLHYKLKKNKTKFSSSILKERAYL